MRASLPALTRLAVSLAVGAIAGILTAMLLRQYATPVGVVLATCAVVFGGWVGSELALRRRGHWNGRHLVLWFACLGVASVAYGILMVLLTPTGVWVSHDVLIAWSLVLSPAALWGLVGGLLTGPRGWPALWVDGFVALLVVLAGAAGLALGAGFTVAATYVPPCVRSLSLHILRAVLVVSIPIPSVGSRWKWGCWEPPRSGSGWGLRSTSRLAPVARYVHEALMQPRLTQH